MAHLTKEKGADIVVMDMPLLDTRRGKDLMEPFLSDIVLQVLSFVAENERKNIRQRQAEGIAEAKKQGRQLGRKKTELPAEWELVTGLWKSGSITAVQAMDRLGLKKSTFYRMVREQE